MGLACLGKQRYGRNWRVERKDESNGESPAQRIFLTYMRSNLQKYKLEIKQQKLVEMEYKIYANGLVY
jgi:hypothetical protein